MSRSTVQRPPRGSGRAGAVPGVAAAMCMVVCAGLLSSCQGRQATDDGTLMSGVEAGFGSSQLTPQQIQSQVMGFADTFANRYAQAADELENTLDDPRRKAGVHSGKIGAVLSAYSIAVSQSSFVSLLDMIVFITLQRIIYEEVWQFQLPIGAEGDQMLIALHASEREIWAIAANVLNDDQQRELHEMIMDWRAANPTQNYVSRVRFAEFGNIRAIADEEDPSGGRQSLFRMLALDPLSNLDPTNREIRASRLSAERMAYFAKRLPMVLAWYPQQAAYDITATPAVVNLMANVDQFRDSFETVSGAVESWPEVIASEREALLSEADQLIATASETMAADLHEVVTAEREAAIEQLADAVREERELTIEQLHEAFRTERESMQAWIDSEHAELSQLVGEVNEAILAGDELAKSSNALLQTYQRLNPSAPEGEQSEPVDIAAYTDAIKEAGEAARELRELADSIRGLLETESATGQENAIANTLNLAQSGATSVVDRAFRYALVLLALFLIGLPISLMVVSRLKAR